MKQNTTYKQTELGLIPDDWEVNRFTDIAELIHGFQFREEHFAENGRFGVIKIGNLTYQGNISLDNLSKSDCEGINNYERLFLRRGDILMALTGGTLGKMSIFNLEENRYLQNYRVGKFEPNEKSIKNYIYYLLSSTYVQKRIEDNVNEAAQPNFGKQDFDKIKIPLPPLPEQKKIADCLSTWDVAIEKQNALINALTDRKKALMQQLLTGKKRLPGFEGKWNLNSINDLFIFKNGKAHENDIDENGKYILVNSKFISTDGEILKKTNSNLAPLEVNDLVFVMSDVPNGKALAKFFLIKEDNLYTLNQRIGLLKIKKGNPIFMYYLLNRNAYFLMFDNGVGQTNLRKDDILDCPLNIPSLSEQTAIAEILATADRELTLQKEKLAQLQTQKKGLMQVLLTGKKRLLN